MLSRDIRTNGKSQSASRNAPRDVVIVGCGNLLRGDDAAGPAVVDRIAQLGCPAGVRLVDSGTAGFDVALAIEGAREAVIIDACQSGSLPGEVFELRGEEVCAPSRAGVNIHALRWDSAIALARRQLKDRYPDDVSVILIEAQSLDYGIALSAPVRSSVEAVARDLIARFSAAQHA